MAAPRATARLSSAPMTESTPSFFRPCWVEIHTESLRHNLRLLKQRLAPSTRLCAVVKADGYGHGLLPVSRLAVAEGAVLLGVSSLEEGVSLREGGVRAPVLILGSLFPFDSFSLLFDHQLTPTVASLEAADALNSLAQKRGKRLPVHLKIDSGFGRIGVSLPHALDFMEQVAQRRALEIEGVYTHFASSDVEPDYTHHQTQTFQVVVEAARAKGICPPLVHLANSSALLQFPETHGTMVRPGLAFYGLAPYAGAERDIALRPALAWKTRIVFLKTVPKGATISYARTWTAQRTTRIATLAVGYADGLPRLLSNQGQVLVGGARVPILGRVTMDMTMVDVTDLPHCHVGDEVVLIGAQGQERLGAEDIAHWAKTNAYEILCGIAARVPRVYLS